ncbi:gluconate 2-dehydrogenase subunit 3 family protein [Ureibacillus acetophenoni]|uniref:Gluconate 2-dehydrogenase gamma chain n=1 Tax=Ureibacillus acetophenoni TaxID=614649 RepID=A0A285URE6_9BACL|nr:gluconate 2-dehydrogenase subunit 3 family protein [Ureibacillus acetophenoni]SOC44444.1 gluconate 2-dehydrogenase gamma chain [Ureibacillus acetophenoni]
MSEKEKEKDSILEKRSSRRTFIKNSGLTVGGVVLGGAIGSLFGTKNETTTMTQVPVTAHPTEIVNYNEALQFFTRLEDFQALSAATEQIFPEDEHGPGAIKLGAPYYIDKQLASPWGRNVDDYMLRPFKNGQNEATRGEIMLEGLRKLNDVSKINHNNTFSKLKEDEQITILKDFELGKIDLILTSSATFFALLRQLTIEGCYCDPLYGGNKNLEGWKMKEFPGAYLSHIDVVENKEFVAKKPQSLSSH